MNYIGIDIGGTNLKAGLVNDEGSISLNISAPYAGHRPLSCQISEGCTMGIMISWAPVGTISSRMISSIFRRLRQARGR